MVTEKQLTTEERLLLRRINRATAYRLAHTQTPQRAIERSGYPYRSEEVRADKIKRACQILIQL